MKICVYAIALNEERFVERFCAAAKDADLILIADTGSTDKTKEIAERCGAKVYDISIKPWRFDTARNTALALVPADMDVCISIDLDEVLELGWREELEAKWLPGTTRMRWMYDWGSGLSFKYEKVHARHGYQWKYAVHEYPVPDVRTEEVWADTDKFLARHYPDGDKNRKFYLDLLEMAVKEDPHHCRNVFYYGRELFFNGRYDEAIPVLMKYLTMPDATWNHERGYAMRVISKCHWELKQEGLAEVWLYRAMGETPNAREPWCDAAAMMYRLNRWDDCYLYARHALRIGVREPVYTTDPEAWGALPHDLASISAWHLGWQEEAIHQVKMAITLDPDNKRLQENLAFFTKEQPLIAAA